MERIELPDDSDSAVFVMYQPMGEMGYKLSGLKELQPWLTVHADGRTVCQSANSQPITATISHTELKWLLHLAVNECDLLSKKTADYTLQEPSKEKSGYQYKVSVKLGKNQLELPTKTLILKSLRFKLGLYPFKALNLFAMGISNRVNLGTKKQAVAILKVVN